MRKELELAKKVSVAGAKQAVITNLVQPDREHMLKKAAYELQGRQGHGLGTVIA